MLEVILTERADEDAMEWVRKYTSNTHEVLKCRLSHTAFNELEDMIVDRKGKAALKALKTFAMSIESIGKVKNVF